MQSTDRFAGQLDFQQKLSDHYKGMFLKEWMLFRKMMNLMFSPVERIDGDLLVKQTPSTILISRLLNDFYASMHLMFSGLHAQAWGPMRDAAETMLFLMLFEKDQRRSKTWIKDLKRIDPTEAAKKANEPAADQLLRIRNWLSDQCHPNFLPSLLVVEEWPSPDGKIVRGFHFGGLRDENLIASQFDILFVLQTFALAVVFRRMSQRLDAEHDTWWSAVRQLEADLDQQAKERWLKKTYDRSTQTGRIARKVARWMKVPLAEMQQPRRKP